MKTAILITARLKSTRLPMKAIKPIKDRPMICHMLDRLKLARQPSQIIIATSTVEQDDPLVEIAQQENVECFRGDPDDVLVRLTEAANQFGVDTVISCTADNPFVDPFYIDKLVLYHNAEKNDRTDIVGLPFGVFSHAISVNAMEKACEIKAEKDTEVWGGYFSETGLFKIGKMVVTDPAVIWPELRLTVDTPEDFALVTEIFEELYLPGRVFSLESIIDLCRKREDLALLNSKVVQKPGKPIKLKSGVLKK